MNKDVGGVGHKKALWIRKNKEEERLEITYSSLSSGGGGDVFLLLPRVLLEGGAFVDGLEPKAWVCS